MAVSLPLTLAGSFFSPKGLETLHKKQDAHQAEDALLSRFFKQRSAAYHSLSSDLSNSLVPEESAKGFAIDEGASLKAAFFRGLQEADTTAQARLYKHVANDLDNKLISPYDRYVEDYAERISTSRKTLQSHLNAFEKGLVDVGKTKTAYHQKCGRADQEEDEARFHAVTESPPLSSTSTRSKPAMSPLAIPEETEEMDEHRRSPRALMTPAEEGDLTPIAGPAMQDEDEPTPPAKPSGLNRKSTVADRLRALTKDSGVSSAVSGDKRLEDSDGLLEIGDVVNASKQWSSFFSTAAKEIPKKSLKIPLWGVYHDLVTGQDLVVYFMENLVALENDYQRAYEFSRQLAEELYLIRLIGEFGNRFSDEYDSYYQFKPEIFHLDNLQAASASSDRSAFAAADDGLTKLPGTASPRLKPSSPDPSASPPLREGPASPKLAEQGANLMKRSNTIFHNISSRFSAVSSGSTSPTSKIQKVRIEAQEAEKLYRQTVKRVEVLRMTADQQTESHLQYMHKLELDRLRFMKATLKRYQAIAQTVAPQALLGKTDFELMIQAMQPEADLQALCEMYRITNGYRPEPILFQDHYGEFLDANFGVDLRRWEEVQLHQGKKVAEITVPPVLLAMLDHIQMGYASLPQQNDRRRIWYLDIPLTASHALRTALNDARRADKVPMNLLKQSDLPVVAAVVKLFFLELDPPVIPYSAYDSLHSIYPQVAGSAKSDDEADNAGRVEKLKEFLSHLPRVNLHTLDALLRHLRQLVDETKEAEGADPEDLYLAKLSHSMARCITRPKLESGISLHDKAPAYLLADLVRLRDQVMPDVIEQRTKQELDRFKPKRKRTRPVDMRISRSSLGDAKPAQAQELLADQLHQKEPPSVPSLPSPPSVSKSLAEVEEPAHTTLNSASADAHVGEAEPDRSIEIDPDAQVSFANESIHSISRVPEAKPSSPPLAAAQSRSGDEMDAPFVPPADEPFDVPTEDSPVADERSPVSPLSAASSTGFSRAPRVKGPRVAQAAQRFSVPSNEGAARLSRSFAHRKSNSNAPGPSPVS